MNKEEKEVIDRLTKQAITYPIDAVDYPNTIVARKDLVTVLKLIDKRNKVIDELIQELTDDEFDNPCTECCKECEKDNDTLFNCIKQYFIRKVEEDE